MTSDIVKACLLTINLALVTTVLLVAFSIPLAWYLRQQNTLMKRILYLVLALPLILPPVVLGFYILIAFTKLNAWFDIHLAFSFSGLVIGSMLYSLPFALYPMVHLFNTLNQESVCFAESLGVGPFYRFTRLVLPYARRGIVSASILVFVHTLGEFGVVLMIGGNIPGQTRVLSIALFEYVEVGQYSQAHILSAIVLVTGLVTLIVLQRFGSSFYQKPHA